MNSVNTKKHHHAHHFESAEAEFQACKLGMWMFLLTEILLFGGLFVAYAVFRSWYPEIFQNSSTQLDVKMGGINTAVLITSSLTMALAIRAGQTSNKPLQVKLLISTLLLAGVFLVIKYFEYQHKFHLGIFPGKFYNFAGSESVDLTNARVFFSIYFLMTGLHAVHVILGMGAISWVAIRASKGEFHSGYYTPLEMVGLYWHLVDLIWIFLFPLMYLI